MQVILVSILILALLRWVAARYLRSRGRAEAEVLAEGVSASHADRLSPWKALQREVLAWLVVAGALAVLLLLALVWVHYFGSFRPVHEWGT